MNIHNNARLTPIGRERIVMQVASGQTPQAAARAAGVRPRTIRKWVARYAVEGDAGGQACGCRASCRTVVVTQAIHPSLLHGGAR
jgi:transposase-like protein